MGTIADGRNQVTKARGRVKVVIHNVCQASLEFQFASSSGSQDFSHSGPDWSRSMMVLLMRVPPH